MLHQPDADPTVIKFEATDIVDGRPRYTLAFTGVRLTPLGYQQLLDTALHQPMKVPLDWRNAKIVSSDVPNIDVDAVASAHADLDSHLTSRVVALVAGGWLPSALATADGRAEVLLDRNVVTEIVGRFEAGRLDEPHSDFIDLIAGRKVRLNPMLWVLEGNEREIPTPEKAQAQLEEVVTKLTAALPDCVRVVGPNSLQGALGLIEDGRPGLHAKQAFLLKVAPFLKSPVSRSRADARWTQILQCADAADVRRASLVVLAALSIAAVPNGASPAAKVMKFKAGYGPKDAYNALADLRSLEVLMAVIAMAPERCPQIWTADRPLALLWAALGATNFRQSPGVFTFDLNPNAALIPETFVDRYKAIFTPA